LFGFLISYKSIWTDTMTRMDKRKVIPLRPVTPFIKEAEKRWSRIPKSAQARTLKNVFCVNCADSVPIILESAKMERDDLILRGKCKVCGHKVCQLVEPEN